MTYDLENAMSIRNPSNGTSCSNGIASTPKVLDEIKIKVLPEVSSNENQKVNERT